MKSKLLLFIGGVVLASSASAAALCQNVLVAGNFQELITAGSCNVGNVLFSGFNTNMGATNLLVSTNGGASSAFGALMGFTYNYVGGTLPGGTVGWTATFDATAGVGCPVLSTCGLVGTASQIHVFVPNPAVVNNTFTGGFAGTNSVNGSSLAAQSVQTSFTMVSAPTSVVYLANYNGLGNLSSFETDMVTASTSAVPESASLVILGTGLLGLGFIKRSRNKRST